MTVTFRALRYRVEYTRFSRTEKHQNQLQQYLKDSLGTHTSGSVLALTPTPSETGGIKVSQWTLTTGTIGYRASGRVSVGINPKGKLIALKRITVGKDRRQVQHLRQTLETLTSLAENQGKDRLLRFIEIIVDNEKGINATADL